MLWILLHYRISCGVPVPTSPGNALERADTPSPAPGKPRCSFRSRRPSKSRQLRQDDVARNLVGVARAAVDQNHDAEPLVRHHADIGRGVVDTAGLIDDCRAAKVVDLPGERLRAAGADAEYAALRELHRRTQVRINPTIAEIGGKQGGEIARRREHLAGAG